MRKFKYSTPKKVANLFYDNEITDVTLNGRRYHKEHWMELTKLGIINDEDLDNIIDEYSGLSRADFIEVYSTVDEFDLRMKQLEKDIDELPSITIGDFYLLTLHDTNYSIDPTFLIERGQIVKINDNAIDGIGDNLREHLKGKIPNLGKFTWTMDIMHYYDLEEVHKFYYYDAFHKKHTGTGAGTLTGWLTDEEAERRSKGNVLIKLNSVYRLKN